MSRTSKHQALIEAVKSLRLERPDGYEPNRRHTVTLTDEAVNRLLDALL